VDRGLPTKVSGKHRQNMAMADDGHISLGFSDPTCQVEANVTTSFALSDRRLIPKSFESHDRGDVVGHVQDGCVSPS